MSGTTRIPERREILNEMLLTPIETSLGLYNLNVRLAEFFGPPAVAVAAPRLALAMRFYDVYDVAHRDAPLVRHEAYLRPETNSAEVRRNVRITSPFHKSAGRMPLVGVSFVRATLQDPDTEPFTLTYFEVKPVSDASTIVTIAARTSDWQAHGQSLLDITYL